MSIAWTPGQYPTGCINVVAMALSHALINLVTDALILALPLVLVLKSPIDTSNKSKHTFNMSQNTIIDMFQDIWGSYLHSAVLQFLPQYFALYHCVFLHRTNKTPGT
jgi:hypothetical protein